MRAVRWTILGLLFGALLAEGEAARAAPSSYNLGAGGTRVLYALLRDLGYQPMRVFDLKGLDPRKDALILLGPESRVEVDRLMGWVGSGLRLVFAPSLLSEDGLCTRFRLGKLAVERTRPEAKQQTAPAHADLRLRSSACLLVPPSGASVLAGTAKAALAVDLREGSGRALLLAHEDLLVNLNLDADDVAVLLRRWLSANLQPGTRVLFLEGQEGGQFLDVIRRTNLIAFCLHAVVWLLLLYWALAPRFGDPGSPIDPTRRAFAQHARALGGLYRHRGASNHLLRQLYQRFLSRSAGRLERKSPIGGVVGRLEPVERKRSALAALVATRAGQDQAAVEALLAQIEQATATSGDPDPKEQQRHFRLSQSLAALQRGSAMSTSGGRRADHGRPKIR